MLSFTALQALMLLFVWPDVVHAKTIIMEKDFAESGVFVSQEAVTKRSNLINSTLIVMGVLGVICGILTGLVLYNVRISAWAGAAVYLFALVLFAGFVRWIFRKFDQREQERSNCR